MRIMSFHPTYVPVPKEEKLEIKKRIEDRHKDFIIGDNYELENYGQVVVKAPPVFPVHPPVPLEEQALAMMDESEIISSIERIAGLFSQAVVDLDLALAEGK